MRRLSLAAALTALLAPALTGCVSESADIGVPPPVLLTTASRVVPLPSARRRIWHEIYALSGGNTQAVRARVLTRGDHEGQSVREKLIALGLDPVHISVEIGTVRHPSEIILTYARAMTAPCAAAIAHDFPDDPSPSLMSLAHCNQRNNLANMVADPADLAAPPRLRSQDGAYLAAGVESWRRDRTRPLSQPSTEPSSNDGSLPVTAPSSTTAPVNTVPVPVAQPTTVQ